MKRQITTTITALSLLLGFALWSAEPGKPAAAMQATYPLNPNNFTWLGASPFTSKLNENWRAPFRVEAFNLLTAVFMRVQPGNVRFAAADAQ
jgi:hypothetical protein